jgi:signal transduction histidine kinase
MTGLKFIDNASRELREIYDDLYPSILSDMGLASTIRWYAKNSLEIKQIKVRLDIKLEDVISHPLEVDIYRIIKELFSNIIKHSGADSVNIILSNRGSVIKLEISDNGIGFNMDQIFKERKGFGLSNIRQRVNSHGGSYVLNSTPGAGTSVRIIIEVE